MLHNNAFTTLLVFLCIFNYYTEIKLLHCVLKVNEPWQAYISTLSACSLVELLSSSLYRISHVVF